MAPKVGSLAEVPQLALEVLVALLYSKIEAPASIDAPMPAFARIPIPTSTLAGVPASIEVISLEDDSAVVKAC